MAAASTDKLRKWSRKWVGQIGAGGVSDNSTVTIPLSSTTNLPTDTGVTLVIDRVDSAGALSPAKEETIVGVVSGSNMVTSVRGVEGTAQAHSAGAVVELLVTASEHNDMIDAFLVGHTQAGAHASSIVGLTTAQTLTNKTLTDSTNNVMAKSLKSATTTVDVSAATAPSSGQVLTATASTTATWQTPTVANSDGWTAAGTFTYASASTITVDSGAAAIYSVGDRLKWTQTTVKYGVIVTVADTLLTIAVNTDYTVANAAITNPYYSHQDTPVGFPSKFAWTPVWTLFDGTLTTTYTTQAGSYAIHGKTLTARWYTSTNVVTEATASKIFSMSVPVPMAYVTTGLIIGSALFRTASSYYTISPEAHDSTHILFWDTAITQSNFYGTTPDFTIATANVLAGTVTYDIA